MKKRLSGRSLAIVILLVLFAVQIGAQEKLDLQMVQRIREEGLKPVHDLGATTVTLRNTGGTDHLPFDAVGLPGFQFIQDDLEYDTLTHHSNMDVYDHLSRGDLMQAATVMAWFVYNAAMREEKLPRKYFDPNAPAPARGGN